LAWIPAPVKDELAGANVSIWEVGDWEGKALPDAKNIEA
jgi:hypothetical protein